MTRIKELRQQHSETQEKMASLVGITRGAYANIENGKREPDIRTMTILANYFNVSVDYLINHEKLMTFPITDKWTKDMNEDFDNADEKTRVLILTRWGYDPDHIWAAHRYFPWQFSDKKEPTPVSEDGPSETAQVFMPLVDKLTPDQQQLLLAQLQAWTGQNERPSPAAPGSGGGKAPGSDP